MGLRSHTAFTHSTSKLEEAKRLGADHVVSSVDGNAINAMASKLDMLLITANVPLKVGQRSFLHWHPMDACILSGLC